MFTFRNLCTLLYIDISEKTYIKESSELKINNTGIANNTKYDGIAKLSIKC